MVRIKTTEVLCIMATHNVGRWAAAYGNQCQELGGMPLNGLECSELVSVAQFFSGNSIWPEQASVGWFWLPLWGLMEPSVPDLFLC